MCSAGIDILQTCFPSVFYHWKLTASLEHLAGVKVALAIASSSTAAITSSCLAPPIAAIAAIATMAAIGGALAAAMAPLCSAGSGHLYEAALRPGFR